MPASLPQTDLPPAKADPAWSEYINERYNYSIKYPPSGDLNQSDPAHLVIKFVEPFGQGQDVLTFGINIHANPRGLTAEKWALGRWQADTVREQGTVEVAGRAAFHIRTWEADEDSNHIYWNEGKNIYELSYVDPNSIAELPKDGQARLAETFKKMVESFSLRSKP